MGLKVEPVNCRWDFWDVYGNKMQISGTGLVRVSSRGTRGIVNRLAVCKNLVGDMLLSHESQEGISRQWENMEGEDPSDEPQIQKASHVWQGSGRRGMLRQRCQPMRLARPTDKTISGRRVQLRENTEEPTRREALN